MAPGVVRDSHILPRPNWIRYRHHGTVFHDRFSDVATAAEVFFAVFPANLPATIKKNRKSRMNIDVIWLFLSATLTVLAAVGIVLWILRREYLPVIKRLEDESEAAKES